MDNMRQIGDAAELRCVSFLQDNGIKIIKKNYRCHIGEIDIVGWGDPGFLADNGYLIFFEVKYRRGDKAGYAEAAVNYKKQRTISRVADFYMMENKLSMSTPVRFDVLAVDDNIRWYKNAFEYIAR